MTKSGHPTWPSWVTLHDQVEPNWLSWTRLHDQVGPRYKPNWATLLDQVWLCYMTKSGRATWRSWVPLHDQVGSCYVTKLGYASWQSWATLHDQVGLQKTSTLDCSLPSRRHTMEKIPEILHKEQNLRQFIPSQVVTSLKYFDCRLFSKMNIFLGRKVTNCVITHDLLRGTVPPEGQCIWVFLWFFVKQLLLIPTDMLTDGF
jgi:hypothetical protein